MSSHASFARYDFAGRVAVVTGAATGIGRAICDAFALNGASVVNWDRVPGDLDAPHAPRHFAVDITRPASIEAALAATLDAYGRIDYLVNNAGFAGPTMPLDQYDPLEWQRVIDVNLLGTYHVSRFVVPVMRRANSGRIVNVASLAGKEGTPNASAYSAAKAGVIAMTKSLGKELAGYDISVNCITPAAAKTAIFDQMTTEHINYMLSKIPRGRFVLVEEIANLAAFCASQECAFTTGAVFDISGGRATY